MLALGDDDDVDGINLAAGLVDDAAAFVEDAVELKYDARASFEDAAAFVKDSVELERDAGASFEDAAAFVEDAVELEYDAAASFEDAAAFVEDAVELEYDAAASFEDTAGLSYGTTNSIGDTVDVSTAAVSDVMEALDFIDVLEDMFDRVSH